MNPLLNLVICSIDFLSKDYIDLSLKVVGIFGALIAAFKAIGEFKEGRKQRVLDYRWKQSNAAKQLIDEMHQNKFAKDATILLDWNFNVYTSDKGESFVISHDEIKKALRTDSLAFTIKEKYIRDCFDSFLNYLEFMEQSIRNKLFEYQDVIYPMEYYIITAKNSQILDFLKKYMKEYKFKNSLLFIKRVVEDI